MSQVENPIDYGLATLFGCRLHPYDHLQIDRIYTSVI